MKKSMTDTHHWIVKAQGGEQGLIAFRSIIEERQAIAFCLIKIMQ